MLPLPTPGQPASVATDYGAGDVAEALHVPQAITVDRVGVLEVPKAQLPNVRAGPQFVQQERIL